MGQHRRSRTRGRRSRERRSAQEGQLRPPTIRALDEIDLSAKLAVARAVTSRSAHEAGVADAELQPPAETDPE